MPLNSSIPPKPCSVLSKSIFSPNPGDSSQSSEDLNSSPVTLESLLCKETTDLDFDTPSSGYFNMCKILSVTKRQIDEPSENESVYKKVKLMDLSTFFFHSHAFTYHAKKLFLFDRFEAIKTPLETIYADFHEEERWDTSEFDRLISSIVEIPWSETIANEAFLLEKRDLNTLHSYLVFKNDKGGFHILMKPIIRNAARPDGERLCRGSFKFVKKNGLLITLNQDETLVEKEVTVSQIEDYSSLLKDSLLTRTSYADELEAEGFQKISYKKNGRNRVVFIKKDLGLSIPFCLIDISSEEVVSISQKLMANFHSGIHDIKPANIVYDKLTKEVSFIDYQYKAFTLTTFNQRNEGLYDEPKHRKDISKQQLLGLAYVMYYLWNFSGGRYDREEDHRIINVITFKSENKRHLRTFDYRFKLDATKPFAKILRAAFFEFASLEELKAELKLQIEKLNS